MSVSMYRATVPVLIRSFDVLASLLDKATAHAEEKGLSDADVTGARLAEDMLPFSAQIQRASAIHRKHRRNGCRASQRPVSTIPKQHLLNCGNASRRRRRI